MFDSDYILPFFQCEDPSMRLRLGRDDRLFRQSEGAAPFRLADNTGMAVNAEFLLSGHPRLFLGRDGRSAGFATGNKGINRRKIDLFAET